MIYLLFGALVVCFIYYNAHEDGIELEQELAFWDIVAFDMWEDSRLTALSYDTSGGSAERLTQALDAVGSRKNRREYDTLTSRS